MLQQTGTPACTLRDKLLTARYRNQITPKQITDRLTKMVLPDWLVGQIIDMVGYRKHERCTCVVEQAMFQAVCNQIVARLMREEKQSSI